jgi:hypothetical protein
MLIGPFYLGARPAENLIITVRDPQTNEPKNLGAFDDALLRLVSPNGVSIDTTINGGRAEIASYAQGLVTYRWPSTSLFNEVGDYTLQLELTGDNVTEFTNTATFEVYRPVGSEV